MNREIKFRAWDKKRKLLKPAWVLSAKDGSIASVQFEGDREWIEEPVLIQFTGLKDKNGKEIYEGDIIRHKIASPDKFINRKILFSDFSWWAIGKYRKYEDEEFLNSIKDEEIEVIGNIYENPKLIK